MPVTFHYVLSETPPAPYVLVAVSRSEDSDAVNDLPAKVDSAADRTVIPTSLAEQLSLEIVGQQEFEGLGGLRQELVIYQMVLTIRGCSPHIVTVAGSKGEPSILLSRDVLNKYTLLLDGPNSRLEIR